MAEDRNELGFLVEAGARNASDAQGAERRRFDWMPLPASGVAYLQTSGDHRPPVLGSAPGGAGAVAAIERVEIAARRCLVMLTPPAAPLHVNGISAPELAVLQVGDQVRLDGDYVLHVSLHAGAGLHAPHDKDLGCRCPICRGVIGPQTTAVYSCVQCGATYHCEGEEKPEEDRLDCVGRLVECQKCGRAIVMSEGWAFEPES